jgi:hypothetical protein
MLIKHSESYGGGPIPQALMDAMGQFVSESFKSDEFASKDEAMEMARQFMELHRVHWTAFEGECEVRLVEDM